MHGTVPVHGTVAAPELSQGSPDLGAAAQTATSSASSTPVHPGAAAPVHRVQVVASSTAPMAPSSTTGTATSASSTAPAGAAAPVSSVRATASSTTATGRTAATRLVSNAPVDNAHPMRTRGKAGIAQPVDRLNLHAVPMSPLPSSVRGALSDPNWCSAMQAEYDALIANDTWSLVPRPTGVNMVIGK